MSLVYHFFCKQTAQMFAHFQSDGILPQLRPTLLGILSGLAGFCGLRFFNNLFMSFLFCLVCGCNLVSYLSQKPVSMRHVPVLPSARDSDSSSVADNVTDSGRGSNEDISMEIRQKTHLQSTGNWSFIIINIYESVHSVR